MSHLAIRECEAMSRGYDKFVKDSNNDSTSIKRVFLVFQVDLETVKSDYYLQNVAAF